MKHKKADTAFSKYIRKRDSIDGVCTCPLCGHVDLWRFFTCGHYIKRRHLNTRWYPDNAFAICAGCNSEMENDTELLNRYGQWIAEKIGAERWSGLMVQKMRNYKYMQCEVDDFEKKYRNLD